MADPAVLVVCLLAVVALHASVSVAAAIGWSLLAILFCVAIPYLVLVLVIGRGLVMDRHVVVREQRRHPLLAALVSLLVGLGLLVWLQAPRELVALVTSMLAGLLVMTVVSHWSKASFHVGVAGGVVAILGLVLGWWTLWLTLPVLALVSWARIRAGRHTAYQVLVGLVIGSASAAVVFPLVAR